MRKRLLIVNVIGCLALSFGAAILSGCDDNNAGTGMILRFQLQRFLLPIQRQQIRIRMIQLRSLLRVQRM